MINYLSNFISSDTCGMLLIGLEEKEISTSLSQYDKTQVTHKAQHIVDILSALVVAIETGEKIT